MGTTRPPIDDPPPRKRFFFRFFTLSGLIAVLTVIVFGLSVIPAQKRKIIAGLTRYARLIHSALSPVISTAIVLEDYGDAIENSLGVIDENPLVLYVIFGRKDGSAIVNQKNAWHQTSGANHSELSPGPVLIARSPVAEREVFHTSYPVTFSGMGWGYIHIGLSTDEYRRDLKTLYARTFWIALASVTASLVVSFILARRMARPIGLLARTTHQIGEGDLSVRSGIRTGDELEVLSRAIDHMAEALEQSRDEIRKKHDILLDTAHRAGMAETAIDVLHNVGNILNSINVIITTASRRVFESRVSHIGRIAREMEENRDRLSDYLTREGRGEKMAAFLTALSGHLDEENQALVRDMEALSRHVAHITDIVTCQQRYSKSEDLADRVPVDELIRTAVQFCGDALSRHHIRLDYEPCDLPGLRLSRHKVIQILTNLINNAIDSLRETRGRERVIGLSVRQTADGFLVIHVSDNGIGVPPEHKLRIFNHGFTTKKQGHGFGLHSCALFAQDMQGSLSVFSGGNDQGALFELKLPIEPETGRP
ncbi:hypothetical protein JCM14469_28530 [Desulfatiferula olefinivorans]